MLSVLEEFEDSGLRFILETNKILIGADSLFTGELSRFENLLVRVSLKRANREHFQKLTGSEKKGFDLQLKALENLDDNGCSCRAAVIKDFLHEDLERAEKEIGGNRPQASTGLGA